MQVNGALVVIEADRFEDLLQMVHRSGEIDRQIGTLQRNCLSSDVFFQISMDHLLTGTLPGCETIEQAEEHNRIDAMQMELRERRVRNHVHAHRISIKEVEEHFDALRGTDPEVYITYLYAKARLSAVFSHLSDEQLRNALQGISLAIDVLRSDFDVIRPAVHTYRQKNDTIEEHVCDRVRSRIQELLPKMLQKVSDYAETERDAVPREYIAANVWTGGSAAEHSLPAPLAQAALRLRILIYLRHPIDLIREISNWLIDMESSE